MSDNFLVASYLGVLALLDALHLNLILLHRFFTFLVVRHIRYSKNCGLAPGILHIFKGVTLLSSFFFMFTCPYEFASYWCLFQLYSADTHLSMKAWGDSLDADKSSNIRFLGDPSGSFTKAFDTEFESAKIFGQNRSKRYVVTVENGKVKDVFIEPDKTGVVGEFTDSSRTPFLLPLSYCSS